MNIDSEEDSSFTGKEKAFYSVFDPIESTNTPNEHFWLSIPRNFNSAELGTVIFSSKLYKKSKTFGYWVRRYYFLFENYLAYGLSKNVSKIKKYTRVEGLKISLPKIQKGNKKSSDFRLGFFKLNQFIPLKAQKEGIFQEWVQYLRKRCIMVNFSCFYKILGVLGKGSYGKVFLVERNDDKKKFAAKAIAKDHIVTRLLGVSSLFNEVGALKKLTHNNIIKLEEVFETYNCVYLILEYVEGEELYACLHRKVNFSEQECVMVLRSILETLVYMHNKRIVHRDLKLENVLISGDSLSDIKLIDFGLSVDLKESSENKRGGTPGYIAPEVLNTENGKINVTEKSDMFSVGCMLYRLLTGNKLFSGTTAKEILSKNKDCYFNLGKPSVVPLSCQAKDLLNKLLEKNPEKRISSCEALDHPFFKQENILSLSELTNTRESTLIPSVSQYKFDVHHIKRSNIQSSPKIIDSHQNLFSIQNLSQSPNSMLFKQGAGTLLLDFTSQPANLNLQAGECSVGGSLYPINLNSDPYGSLRSLNFSDSTSPSRFSSHFKLEAKLRGLPTKSSFKRNASKKLLSQGLTPATTFQSQNGFSECASLCDVEKDKKLGGIESLTQSRKLVSIGEAKDGDSNTSNLTN